MLFKLKLEITESAMMDNPLIAIEMLTELQNIGVKLSIDDFGTGYSNLAQLNDLKFDILKVDCSFVLFYLFPAKITNIHKRYHSIINR